MSILCGFRDVLKRRNSNFWPNLYWIREWWGEHRRDWNRTIHLIFPFHCLYFPCLTHHAIVNELNILGIFDRRYRFYCFHGIVSNVKVSLSWGTDFSFRVCIVLGCEIWHWISILISEIICHFVCGNMFIIRKRWWRYHWWRLWS